MNRGTRDNAVRLRHAEPAHVPLRHAASSPLQPLTRCCIGWRKNNRTDQPVSYLDTLIKTESGSIEATLRRSCSRDLWHAWRTPDCRMRDVRRIGGERGLYGVPGKILDGVFAERSQSFRYQRRSMDNCSLGRGKMVQDGGTMDGTFHGGIDRAVENIWSGLRLGVVCPNVTRRTKQGEDSPKQACSGWFAAHS